MPLKDSTNPLPEIKMVRHAQAKKMRLRVEPSGIRLTVPMYATNRQIQQFLYQSEQWLIETWKKYQPAFDQETDIPEQLFLFYHTEPFQVIQQQQRKMVRFDWQRHILFIRDTSVEKALQTAVVDYAKQYLSQYLAELSLATGLNYLDCTIRKPKTRWGSCSSKHNIMLHAALVLMPKSIVHSVCIHELVHTRHFDHSPAFWNEVARHNPDYLEQRRQLKNIQLPAWWYIS